MLPVISREVAFAKIMSTNKTNNTISKYSDQQNDIIVKAEELENKNNDKKLYVA